MFLREPSSATAVRAFEGSLQCHRKCDPDDCLVTAFTRDHPLTFRIWNVLPDRIFTNNPKFGFGEVDWSIAPEQ
jgi:hypothetical protein